MCLLLLQTVEQEEVATSILQKPTSIVAQMMMIIALHLNYCLTMLMLLGNWKSVLKQNVVSTQLRASSSRSFSHPSLDYFFSNHTHETETGTSGDDALRMSWTWLIEGMTITQGKEKKH
jgi:hypothetical protein